MITESLPIKSGVERLRPDPQKAFLDFSKDIRLTRPTESTDHVRSAQEWMSQINRIHESKKYKRYQQKCENAILQTVIEYCRVGTSSLFEMVKGEAAIRIALNLATAELLEDDDGQIVVVNEFSDDFPKQVLRVMRLVSSTFEPPNIHPKALAGLISGYYSFGKTIFPDWSSMIEASALSGAVQHEVFSWMRGELHKEKEIPSFDQIVSGRIDHVIAWNLIAPMDWSNPMVQPSLENIMLAVPTAPAVCLNLYREIIRGVCNDVMSMSLLFRLENPALNSIAAFAQHAARQASQASRAKASDAARQILENRVTELQEQLTVANQGNTDEDKAKTQKLLEEKDAQIQKLQQIINKQSSRLESVQIKCDDMQAAMRDAEAERDDTLAMIQDIRDGRGIRTLDAMQEIDKNGNYIFLVDERVPVAVRLRQEFPNAIVTEDFTPSSGRKVDAVIILTRNISHGASEPQAKDCKVHNIPCILCPKTNLEAIKYVMAQNLCAISD